LEKKEYNESSSLMIIDEYLDNKEEYADKKLLN